MGAVLESVPVMMVLAVLVHQVRTQDRVTAYHRVRAPWPFCPVVAGESAARRGVHQSDPRPSGSGALTPGNHTGRPQSGAPTGRARR